MEALDSAATLVNERQGFLCVCLFLMMNTIQSNQRPMIKFHFGGRWQIIGTYDEEI